MSATMVNVERVLMKIISIPEEAFNLPTVYNVILRIARDTVQENAKKEKRETKPEELNILNIMGLVE